ncbi:MAG: hypothetical protein KBH12_05600 [Synergistaceae bacterium]|nr:hypothetical protein [Synergistaceae bacterium]MBP9626943.1 hypothetical protein [Synergistaceae bacterium]MBP9958095.1 hypothetical protein [Synergistaceae bacterium]
MKKLALATLLVVVLATGAFAWGGQGGYGGRRGGGMGSCGFGGGMMGGYGMGQGYRQANGTTAPYTLPNGTKIPENIIAKMNEMQKINVDLRAAMYGNTIDKAKAKALFQKQQTLRNELSNWFFEQYLNSPRS